MTQEITIDMLPTWFLNELDGATDLQDQIDKFDTFGTGTSSSDDYQIDQDDGSSGSTSMTLIVVIVILAIVLVAGTGCILYTRVPAIRFLSFCLRTSMQEPLSPCPAHSSPVYPV